jgi:uncharacterized protein YgbK (DUF1537 family)
VNPSVIALADDLTGAIETGAKFAHCGFDAVVTLWPRSTPSRPCDVLVIDAETRHLDSDEARDRTRRLAESARGMGFELLYLKTDSTLRGNIAASIEALSETFPGREIAYAPAYPALGRTVTAGRLYVDGVAVQQTAFARDPLNPVGGNDIRSLVGQCPRVKVYDGQTEDDVAAAANEILQAIPRPLACGPASLAGHLAQILSLRVHHQPAWPRIKRAALINGSAHPLSAQQATHAWAKVQFEESDALVVFGGDTAFSALQSLGCAEVYPIGEILPGVPVSRMGAPPYHLITKAGGFGPPDILDRIERLLC